MNFIFTQFRIIILDTVEGLMNILKETDLLASAIYSAYIRLTFLFPRLFGVD